MKTPVLIFDASTLISFGMNGLYDELRALKKEFKGHFILTKEVAYETIERPVQVKSFELEALEIARLFEEGILESPKVLGVSEAIVSQKTQEVLTQTNSFFIGRDGPIHIIDLGEASCLALTNMLDPAKYLVTVAVDERTTRLLCEEPESLIALLKNKLHTPIQFDKKTLQDFTHISCIRSAELMFVLVRKKIIKLNDPRTLDALLYAVKSKGCAISEEEIVKIKSAKW